MWVAHHGRANVIAAAHERGETVQATFKATAAGHGPAAHPMGRRGNGPGDRRVDARSLLEAGFDAGLAGPDPHADAWASGASSVASLVAEAVDPAAAPDDALDWHKFGPELATTLLRRQSAGPPTGAHAEQLSEPLARSITNPLLRDSLGLNSDGLPVLDPPVTRAGIISHVELAWEPPASRKLIERLASFAGVILFDKRGHGLSAPLAEH